MSTYTIKVHLLPKGSHRNKRSAYVRQFQTLLQNDIRAKGLYPTIPLVGFQKPCWVQAIFYLPGTLRGEKGMRTGFDVDNLSKTLLDTLRGKGWVLADDQAVLSLHAEKRYETPTEDVGTEVTVKW